MKKHIPFGKPVIGKPEIESVNRLLRQPILVHGQQTLSFEEKFSNYVGSRYAVAVSSCTAGMHLSYLALGIKEGDEVIVTSQTHVATAHCIEFVGAKPIFVDCEQKTGNICVESIESKITKKTRAISIVHFVGIPAEMKKIKSLAKKYKLFIVEDCALALGSRINGVHVGLHGDVGSFSFYPVKHITTIEGGMVITNNKKIDDFIRRARSFGYNKKKMKSNLLYDVDLLGYNYRMNEVEAIIGLAQLERLDHFLNKRVENFNYYVSKLEKIKNVHILRNYDLNSISSNYCITLILKKHLSKFRNQIVEELKKLGVGTSIYYPGPVPLFKYYKTKYNLKSRSFPNALCISNQSISFPTGPHIDKSIIDEIVFCINKVFNIFK